MTESCPPIIPAAIGTRDGCRLLLHVSMPVFGGMAAASFPPSKGLPGLIVWTWAALVFAFSGVAIWTQAAALLHRDIEPGDGAAEAPEMGAQELALALPPAVTSGRGYLYAIKFNSGSVKVGQTIDPARRFGEHRRDASAFKVTIVDYWISEAHLNYLDNEMALIGFCRRQSRRVKREYFGDLAFEVVLGFARGLNYRTALAEQDKAGTTS